MADYTTKAQIVLTVNGKQAQKILTDLEKQSEVIRKKMDSAAKIGDKDTVKKLQRELNKVEKQVNQIKGAANTVEDTLKRLDKATPKELNKALSQMKRELNGIERGSEAWNAHIEKIKQVRSEIQRLHDEMSEDESLWTRMNRWLNDSQTFLAGLAAMITGVVMAGRSAVKAYAEMEQEEANVRKYTGMTAEEVEKLNEEFKKMDTRTSREELNQLAQEAGRLGKTSQEDVLGFVRAADKINVALDDLGEGATLTLSKLAGIFGEEEKLGTEKALLSVGSVINELSQNCSASAPYIANFTSRLGGVGSQANMTIQQIMGFAAVLDSNNQKLEASSTALSQVIVRIYQDPAKYARVAGMDVEKFAEKVKVDMNGALIDFLSTLSKAGNMDVLSPMFKDMGENGSRAIAALSTLSKHIEEVRAQQAVANQAFAEAVSIDKEFDVQNNTVQAGLDKAKKSLNEIAVELGQKLQPAMRFVISSSTLTLKTVSLLINTFIRYKDLIIASTVAIAAYNVVMLVYNTRMKIAAASTALFHGALNVCRGAIPAVRLLLTPLINTVQYFTNGLQVNYAMQQRWSKALSGMKLANWVGLVAAAASAVYILSKRFQSAKEEAEKYQKSLEEMESQAKSSTSSQISLLDSLYRKATDANEAIDDRKSAIQQLRAIYPDYFKDLSDEIIMAGQAKDAYDRLRDSILDSARARGMESMIESLEEEIQKLEAEYKKMAKPYILDKYKYMDSPNSPEYKLAVKSAEIVEAEYRPKIDAKRAQQKELADKVVSIKSKEISSDVSVSGGGSGGGSGAGNTSSAADRFKAEQEWRQKEEALNRIAYATGQKDFIEYTKRMNEIAVEFYDSQLKHTDLSELERTSITADYEEARKKQSEYFSALTIDEENMRYEKAIADLNELYVSDKINYQTYLEGKEESEITHQYMLTHITEEGSKERAKAESDYMALRVAQMDKRQKEYEQLQKQYDKVKSEYFSLSEQEKSEQYLSEIAMVMQVYDQEVAKYKDSKDEMIRLELECQKAILQIKRKYNQISEAEYQQAMQSIESSTSSSQNNYSKIASSVSSSLSSVMSQLSSFISAEMDLQTAKVEKRYDREIELAEGNQYRIKILEKQKEAEIAKIKNEANKKMFAMQVIQAVAQTATNAINAYGSAAAIPTVGFVLAPIAAAAAVAAGALQIATIKKQQQASESQGYAEGGYTKKGRKYEPAGIVHAGEWVASQDLVNSPVYSPIIEALDYAQSNRISPHLPSEAVSMSLTAPAVLASFASASNRISNAELIPDMERSDMNSSDAMVSELLSCISRLNKRLDEPILSVTTMTGDKGIAKAEESYNRLMKNKK